MSGHFRKRWGTCSWPQGVQDGVEIEPLKLPTDLAGRLVLWMPILPLFWEIQVVEVFPKFEEPVPVKVLCPRIHRAQSEFIGVEHGMELVDLLQVDPKTGSCDQGQDAETNQCPSDPKPVARCG